MPRLKAWLHSAITHTLNSLLRPKNDSHIKITYGTQRMCVRRVLLLFLQSPKYTRQHNDLFIICDSAAFFCWHLNHNRKRKSKSIRRDQRIFQSSVSLFDMSGAPSKREKKMVRLSFFVGVILPSFCFETGSALAKHLSDALCLS